MYDGEREEKTLTITWLQVHVSKENESMWTYDMTIHLTVELDAVIALATMIYIIKKNLYKLHIMNERGQLFHQC
jgi:hypothetical protein